MTDVEMKKSLSDAYFKLQRARQHISELEGRIVSYLSSRFYEFDVEDIGGGRYVLFLKSLVEPSGDIGAIIGDAISNTRSVLDYVAVELCRGHCEDAHKRGFPFADNAVGFAGQVRSKTCFFGCPVDIQRFFIDDVQAYKGGVNSSLWSLNKLRNIDKHRLLVTATHWSRIEIEHTDERSNKYNFNFNVSAGERWNMVEADELVFDLKKNGKPSFEITINEVLDSAGTRFDEPAAQALHGFCDSVEVLLQAIESKF